MSAPWKKSYDKPRQHIKKQRHHFANKVPYSQSYGFSSSRVWIWELDLKEGWALKNRCFPTVVLEKTPESPFDGKIQPVHPKGKHSEYSLEGLMLKLWYSGHLMQRAGSLEKTLMLARSVGRKRVWQRMKCLDGINSTDMSLSKLQETVKDREPSVCCSPWGLEESDRTEWLNNKQCNCKQKPLRSQSLSNSLIL